MERLQKVIPNRGYTSRRKAEELIQKGKVYVNGEVVKELGTKVSYSDEIVVEGVTLAKDVIKVYYLLNKSRACTCSTNDELGRKTVNELIASDERIYSVGRLDYDTTGLIILTNDGELANILMHPSNDVEKVYIAKIEGIMTTDDIKKLKSGIVIDGIKCIPKRVKIKKKDLEKGNEIVEISIVEGRNHIVKRLFKELGYDVMKLKRERYAFLDVKNLQTGEYRMLDTKEVKKLYSLKKSSN